MSSACPVVRRSACAVLVSFLAASAHAQNAVVHAGTLYAVPGQPPMHEATVVVEAGSVREVLAGYRDPAGLFDPGVGSIVVDLKDGFVVPGLIDCHTHITHQSVPREEAMRRTLTETETPLGILTAFVGAPVFLWLLASGRRVW